MAPSPIKRVSKVKKSAKKSKAASISPTTDHTIPRRERQLKPALSTLNSSPAQNRLDAQLQSDLPSAEKPKSPSKNPHRPAGSHVIEDNTDADFKKQYLEIQDRAWTWAQRFFKEDPSHPFVPSDLSKLATNYPELMEYINMTTSCAPTDTWEQTIHYKQAEIAFSILGKVLEVHVFGEELFGASEEQRRELQEKDEEMMDSDGMSPRPPPFSPPPPLSNGTLQYHPRKKKKAKKTNTTRTTNLPTQDSPAKPTAPVTSPPSSTPTPPTPPPTSPSPHASPPLSAPSAPKSSPSSSPSSPLPISPPIPQIPPIRPLPFPPPPIPPVPPNPPTPTPPPPISQPPKP